MTARCESANHASRANSGKHGLTGDGTVLPNPIRDDLDRRMADWHDLYNHGHAEAPFLFRQLCLSSVRIELCQRALLALEPLQPAADLANFHEDRDRDAAALFRTLSANPPVVRHDLRRSSAGCRQLLEAWTALRIPLANPDHFLWTQADLNQAFDLLGVPTSQRRHHPRCVILASLFHRLHRPDAPVETREADRTSLRHLVDNEISELRSRVEELSRAIDNPRLALVKAGLIASVTPEMALYRRYEAAAARLYWKTLGRMETLGIRRVAAASAAEAQHPSPQLPPPQEVASASDQPAPRVPAPAHPAGIAMSPHPDAVQIAQGSEQAAPLAPPDQPPFNPQILSQNDLSSVPVLDEIRLAPARRPLPKITENMSPRHRNKLRKLARAACGGR